MSVPRWSPGDCTRWRVDTTGIVRCQTEHSPVRSYVPETEPVQHVTTFNGSGRGLIDDAWPDDHPHAYDVRPDEHEPCHCEVTPYGTIPFRTWVDVDGERHLCGNCEGAGLLHDRWCGCTPPTSMVGVGSVLVDPADRKWVVYHSPPGLFSIVAPTTGERLGMKTSLVSREGGYPDGWWVARWVPPSHDNETDRP